MPLSGASWVKQFPGSNKLEDLTTTFAWNVRTFLRALDAAGAHVKISATWRPAQRAYLMHYAWMIVHGKITPDKVPAFVPTKAAPDAVDITWLHTTADGKPDVAASKAAAAAMATAYGIGHLKVPPALDSLHIRREAIDMNISWTGTLTIQNVLKKDVAITTTPRNGTNGQLIIVGAGYKVKHLLAVNKDKPHWSTTGH